MFKIIKFLLLYSRTAFIISITLLLGTLVLHWHPVFNISEGMDLPNFISNTGGELELKDSPERLSHLFRQNPATIDKISDRWIFHEFLYPPFKFSTQNIPPELEDKIRAVNRSADLINEGSFAAAIRLLRSYYNVFPKRVIRNSYIETPVLEIPNDDTEKFVFGALLYNRALARLNMVNRHCNNLPERYWHINRLMYELRRSVNAMERIDGVFQNWEERFDIKQIYAHLSVGYLRARDIYTHKDKIQSIYPVSDDIDKENDNKKSENTYYLIRMKKKYSSGDTRISDYMGRLVLYYLDHPGIAADNKAYMYLIIMAMHNMEWASREFDIMEAPKFSYILSVIFHEIASLPLSEGLKNEALEFAKDYFNRTITACNNKMKRVAETEALVLEMIKNASQKELILINIMQAYDKEKIFNDLQTFDFNNVESLACGPDKESALTFSVLTRMNYFARGDIEAIKNYHEKRMREMKDEGAKLFHLNVLTEYAKSFFSALSERMRFVADEGRITETGAALSQYNKMHDIRSLSFIKDGEKELNLSFLINISTMFHESEAFRILIAVLKWAFPAFFLLHLSYFLYSHIRQGGRTLYNEYNEYS